jgi:putative aminopeptidase FrvX
MVNLEQIGRTDDSEGPRVAEFNVTGYDFSDLAETLRTSAEREQVKVTKHARNSDAYFFASDNAALAGFGVPAHTISTAYQFPDYHKPEDEWQKLDYTNMVKIVRAIARGVETVANRTAPVKWNAENPKATRYFDAWKKLQTGG